MCRRHSYCLCCMELWQMLGYMCSRVVVKHHVKNEGQDYMLTTITMWNIKTKMIKRKLVLVVVITLFAVAQSIEYDEYEDDYYDDRKSEIQTML